MFIINVFTSVLFPPDPNCYGRREAKDMNIIFNKYANSLNNSFIQLIFVDPSVFSLFYFLIPPPPVWQTVVDKIKLLLVE